MQVIKSENIKFFDVDGTLILPSLGIDDPPKSLYADIYDAVTEKYIRVLVHQPMVRLLREEHHRGGHVIVWSRSGYEWAANVVRALDLVPYVNQVMSKPLAYFDDADVSTWMKDRVYLTPDTVYKKSP